MKILIFLVCAVVAINAIPREKAPTFEVVKGKLVRTDRRELANNGRIVGGVDADPLSAPWMVSLQWGTIRPSHFCGGSIINPNWVLTSGHCIQAFPQYGIRTIVAGIHDLTDFPEHVQIRHLTLTNTWVHDDFDGFRGDADIGLTVFQTPFAFSERVGAIALPTAGEMHTGIVTVNGWGIVSETFLPELPDVLQTADIPLIPLATCRTHWGSQPIGNNHICAGTEGADACQFDDGGALVQDGEIVGIVSWGALPCGQPDRPSISVRVSAFVTWIEDIVDNVRI